MNRRISIAVLVIALALTLPSGLSAQEERERSLKLPEKRFGLIVNFTGLAALLIAEHQDPVQSGLGFKFWMGEKSAVRGLLDFELVNSSGSTTTTIGVSGAYEYHLLQQRISPYLGGQAGLQVETGASNNLALYFGALLGAEFEVVENVNLFGEYGLFVEIDEPDFSIDLGLGNSAQLGLIIYLN